MPVFDTSILTKFIDGSTDLGGNGWVLREYILDVYPNLVPGVKTPALWLWGTGTSGQLGDNTIVSKSSPVQTVQASWKQVQAGRAFTAALKSDGTLWSWGTNTLGQLGDNTTVTKSSPVQTIGGSSWVQISCKYSNMAAIKIDGTLWTWGSNSYQELGDGTSTRRSSPVQTVAGGTNWKQVAAGSRRCAAIKTDGTLWMWGNGGQGDLGNGSIFSQASPTQTVAGGSNWVQVSCGHEANCAIKSDGTLWCWGTNTDGQVGNNSVASVNSPVQTVAGGNNWKFVTSGYRCNAAIKTDGTLWLWGLNYRGGLGDGTGTSRSSPVQTIARGNTWNQVSGGYYYNAAIKTDGTLWTWGANTRGQLGDNTTVQRNSPVQTIIRGTFWKQVATSVNFDGTHMAAIADGNY